MLFCPSHNFKRKAVSECAAVLVPVGYENRAVCENTFIYILEDHRHKHKLPQGIASACTENLLQSRNSLFFFNLFFLFICACLRFAAKVCPAVKGPTVKSAGTGECKKNNSTP